MDRTTVVVVVCGVAVEGDAFQVEPAPFLDKDPAAVVVRLAATDGEVAQSEVAAVCDVEDAEVFGVDGASDGGAVAVDRNGLEDLGQPVTVVIDRQDVGAVLRQAQGPPARVVRIRDLGDQLIGIAHHRRARLLLLTTVGPLVTGALRLLTGLLLAAPLLALVPLACLPLTGLLLTGLLLALVPLAGLLLALVPLAVVPLAVVPRAALFAVASTRSGGRSEVRRFAGVHGSSGRCRADATTDRGGQTSSHQNRHPPVTAQRHRP